jgi:juvenile hormone epoxide hydrolase
MAGVNTPASTLKHFVSALLPQLFLDQKDEWKVIPFGEKFKFLMQETGYAHIQATKPDTVCESQINE